MKDADELQALSDEELKERLDAVYAEVARLTTERGRRAKIRADAAEQKAVRGELTDEELVYSARARCPCGLGLAYPKDTTVHGYWDCSGILTGRADPNVPHTDKLPFAFYSIKAESEYWGTTRPEKNEP